MSVNIRSQKGLDLGTINGTKDVWCNRLFELIRDFTLATRSSFISRKMAGFDTNLNYGTFDPDMDPTSVGSRFRKYVERFKVYALAMNIKDKARKRALFLHCAGQKVQDIFDTQ